MPASLVLWEHPALGMVVSVVGWLYSTACLKFYNMANVFKTSFFRAENKLVRERYIYTHIYFFPPLVWCDTGLTLAPCFHFPGYQAGQVTRVTSRYFNCVGCASLAGAAASHLLTHLTPTARHLCFALCVLPWVSTLPFPEQRRPYQHAPLVFLKRLWPHFIT